MIVMPTGPISVLSSAKNDIGDVIVNGEFHNSSFLRSFGEVMKVFYRVVPVFCACVWLFTQILSAQDGRLLRDEGIRYLKLGNTYREAQNYELAQKYLNKGLQMVTNLGSRYWEAVGYEYIGLLQRDMGNRQASLDNLRRAAGIYDRIIRQKDGSQAAVKMLIEDVEQGADKNNLLRSELQRQQSVNRELQTRVRDLETRIQQMEQIQRRPSPGGGGNTSLQTIPELSDKSRVPQGQYAEYSVDKKVVPKLASDTAFKPVTLAKLVIQLGVGAGIGLQSTTGAISVPLVALSVDYFLSDNISAGLIGAYSFGDPQYQFVGVRAAYHFIRTASFDTYAGISGGIVWPSPKLQWYGGLLIGAQYNFTSMFGVFVDATLGAANNVYSVPADTEPQILSVTGFGGYARAGLSISF